VRQFRFGRRDPSPDRPQEPAALPESAVDVAEPLPRVATPLALPTGSSPVEPADLPRPPGPERRGPEPPPDPPVLPGAQNVPIIGRPLLARPLAAAPPVLSSPDQVPGAIVDGLATFLEPVTGLPDPAVVVLQLAPRSLGIGGLRGLGREGGFAVKELRGGHVEATVRFQVWGDRMDSANAAMLGLQGRIFAAQSSLYAAGFLEVAGTAGALADQQGEAWARTGDYRVLFEYHLAPAPDAGSLIARIPIHAEQVGDAGLVTETTTIGDDLVRWDEQDAPALVLRGARAVDSVAALSFVPGPAPTGSVRVLRTNEHAAGPPRDFATLPEFLAALDDPLAPETHGQLNLASLGDFLTAFTPVGDTVPLGDWDGVGGVDAYEAGRLDLTPAVQLPTAQDRLEISLELSPFDQVAVVYLRAAGSLV
jgi:hypothetical protein